MENIFKGMRFARRIKNLPGSVWFSCIHHGIPFHVTIERIYFIVHCLRQIDTSSALGSRMVYSSKPSCLLLCYELRVHRNNVTSALCFSVPYGCMMIGVLPCIFSSLSSGHSLFFLCVSKVCFVFVSSLYELLGIRDCNKVPGKEILPKMSVLLINS